MTPRYQAIHTGLFVLGMLALPLGLVAPKSGVFLLGGLCFVAAGLMTILGHRFTMRGPIGGVLRRVVGGVRLGGAYVVGTLWLMFGVLLVTVGMYMLSGSGDMQPPHAPPAMPTLPRAAAP